MNICGRYGGSRDKDASIPLLKDGIYGNCRDPAAVTESLFSELVNQNKWKHALLFLSLTQFMSR